MVLYKKIAILKRISIKATLNEANKRYGGRDTDYLFAPNCSGGELYEQWNHTAPCTLVLTCTYRLTLSLLPKLTPQEFHSFTRRNHHRIAMHRFAAVRACCFWCAKETLAHNFTLKKMHMQHVRAIQCCTTFRFRLLPPFRPLPACN